jgi:hypothetical protein
MSLSFASQQRVTEGSVPSQDGNHFIKYLKSISEYGLFTFRNSKFLTFTLTLHRRWRFPPTYPKGAYRPPSVGAGICPWRLPSWLYILVTPSGLTVV